MYGIVKANEVELKRDSLHTTTIPRQKSSKILYNDSFGTQILSNSNKEILRHRHNETWDFNKKTLYRKKRYNENGRNVAIPKKTLKRKWMEGERKAPKAVSG